MGVPKNRWLIMFIRENPTKMDDLGVPLFYETPKSIKLLHLITDSYWSWLIIIGGVDDLIISDTPTPFFHVFFKVSPTAGPSFQQSSCFFFLNMGVILPLEVSMNSTTVCSLCIPIVLGQTTPPFLDTYLPISTNICSSPFLYYPCEKTSISWWYIAKIHPILAA